MYNITLSVMLSKLCPIWHKSLSWWKAEAAKEGTTFAMRAVNPQFHVGGQGKWEQGRREERDF